MIEIAIGPGGEGILVGQQIRSPAVYLDHWALRKVSADPTMSIRLADAISESGGTLMLSWANLFEFVGLDQANIDCAEEFIEKLVPALFFLKCNPFEVMQREQSFVPGETQFPPHADMGLLNLVSGLEPNGLKPITCRGLLNKARQAKGHSILTMKRTFVEKIQQLRVEYSDDSSFRKLANRPYANRAGRGDTDIILREIVVGLMRDNLAPFENNDALDFLHSIVPAAYADYCLLDARWRDQVNRAGQRLEKNGVHRRLATAISGQDAVERLIAFLGGFPLNQALLQTRTDRKNQ